MSDAAISRAAGIMGKTDDAKVLGARSKRYDTLFNKATHFFQPKDSSGTFDYDFDPLAWGNGFTEGGAWQYRFYLPQDIDGLEKLYGGKDRLCTFIETMMEETSSDPYHVGSYGWAIHEMREAAAIQEDFGLYAHNNQPVHHVLYVAKRAGCNAVADKYLRKTMQKLYTTHGWTGDEDNGEMASWYVLSALGVYSLESAKDEMVLGSPAIKQASVQLPHGRMLDVRTDHQSADNVHVQSVTWTPVGGSSRTVANNVIKFTELMDGGELRFTMGPLPKEASAPHQQQHHHHHHHRRHHHLRVARRH